MHSIVRALAVIGAAAFLAVAFFSVGSREGERREDGFSDFLEGLGADVIIEGATYSRYVGERALWILNARSARYFEAEDRLELDGVHMVLFAKKGGEIGIDAETGQYMPGTEDLFLAGHVVIHAKDGRSLETQYLSYVQEEGVIRTDAPVLMRGGGVVVHGVGLEYRPDTGILKVWKQRTVLEDGSLIGF